jgi:hypothetical protein
MDMGNVEVECEVYASQKVKESDRIWTAGEGNQNPLPNQLREGGGEVAGEFCQGHAS